MTTNFVKALQKRFSKTINNVAGIVKGRSYKKAAEKLGINDERLKAIRQGKVEPDKKEIAKIAAFNWEKEKAKQKAEKEKQKAKEKTVKTKNKSEKIRITPEELHRYVGFPAAAIRERMQPKFKYHEGLAKKTKISTLYREQGRYVTGTRKNSQQMYYYVIIDIAQHKDEPDKFGHNFMAKENVEHMIKEEGDVCHLVHKNEEGRIYSEQVLIFNVLTFKTLYNSYRVQKLLNWSDVPEA